MNIQARINPDKAEIQRVAREIAYSTPLKDFHPGAPKLFATDTLWPFFERLRPAFCPVLSPVAVCALPRPTCPDSTKETV